MSSNYFSNTQIDPNKNYFGNKVNYSDPNLDNDVRFAYNKDREPGYFVTKALDFLSRGQYASAAFSDTVLSQGLTALPSAIANGLSEGLNPQARLSYSDLINRYASDFAKTNPYGTYVIGLGLDIVLDPVTYVGVGLIGKGTKIGKKVLTETGEKVFNKILKNESAKILADFGDDAARIFEKKTTSLLNRSSEGLIASESAERIFNAILSDDTYKNAKLIELGFDELIESNAKLIQDKGLRVFLGFGKNTKELNVGKPIDPLLEITGINRINEKAKEFFNGIKILPGSDLFKVDEDISKNIVFLENELSNANTNVLEDFRDIFKSSGKDTDLNKLSTTFLEIGKAKEQAKTLRGFLTQDETLELTRNVLNKSGLNADETQALSLLQQKVNDINYVEKNLDLLIENVRLFSQSKEANAVVKSQDDFLRYTQALLDGTAKDFVASSAELQGRLASKELLVEKLGKGINIGGKSVSYGSKVKNLTNAEIAKSLPLSKVGKDFVTRIAENKTGVISGIANDIQFDSLARSIAAKGFNVFSDLGNNVGKFTDDSLSTVKQIVFNANDGSIIRLTKKQVEPNLFEFTLTKGVRALDKEFNANILGKEAIEEINIKNISKFAKNLTDEVMLDPFGTVLQTRQQGNLFSKMYDDAIANGADVKTNALVWFVSNTLKTVKEQSKKQFNEGIQVAYGVEKLADLPKKVQERIKYIGEGLYNKDTNESINKAFRLYDGLLGMFKGMVTAFRPAFAPRQLVQNPFQYALFTGKNPLEIFINNNPMKYADPRSLSEASYILAMAGENITQGELPAFVANNLLNKNSSAPAFQAIEILRNRASNFDALKNITISNPFGETITGDKLYSSMKQLGVLKGQISELQKFEVDAVEEVRQAIVNDKSKEGILSFFKNNLAYWKYPQQIEDFFRASYFINAYRSGLSEREAAKLVDKALFNYQTGLTQVETRLMKRIIPFYAFQRNAIPRIVETALSGPGRLATGYKVQEKFFDVWNKLQSGQELTPYERQITPDFIFEQSSVYAGRDANGKLTFNTFNNLTPFDAINLIAFDKVDGSVDVPQTFRRIVLNSLTPFLKIPAEIGFNRLLFSDQLLNEYAKVGNAGRVLDNLPQVVKDELQFEKSIDPISGKEKYYVNPYASYISGSFIPIVNDILRPLDPEKTLGESVRSFLFASQTYKYNEDELSVGNALSRKKQLQEQKNKVKLAYAQGRENEADRQLTRLQKLLELLDEENTYKNPAKPF